MRGGPTLHIEDKPLVGTTIPLKDLVTFRRGELAMDPTSCTLIELPLDMVKIKGKPGGFVCTFLDQGEKACRIYEERPLECRMLQCWNPEPMISLFLKDLLRRMDLFPNEISREYMEDYDKRFPPPQIRAMVFSKDRDALEAMMKKDQLLRRKAMETLGIKEEELSLFLGRPVHELIDGYESLVS